MGLLKFVFSFGSPSYSLLDFYLSNFAVRSVQVRLSRFFISLRFYVICLLWLYGDEYLLRGRIVVRSGCRCHGDDCSTRTFDGCFTRLVHLYHATVTGFVSQFAIACHFSFQIKRLIAICFREFACATNRLVLFCL